MFLTFTNVENDKPVYLEESIDNQCANLTVALRRITFYYNIYNVFEGDYIQDRPLTPGLYNFDELSESLRPELDLGVNEKNGIVSVIEGRTDRLSQNIKKMLGIGGTGYVNLNPTKDLLVHLNELNTTGNILNGRQSNVLTSFSTQNAAFGDLVTKEFLNPERKKLTRGSISSIKIKITNETGRSVLGPYNLVLEVI